MSAAWIDPLAAQACGAPQIDRLEIDAGDLEAIELMVQSLAVQHGWWESSAPAVRTFGRKSPDRHPVARMMYSVPGARRPAAVVDIVERADPGGGGFVQSYRSGWLCLYRFGIDEALPGMQVLLGEHPEAEVIRYRPRQRCTLRIGDRFVKTFSDDRGRQLHADAVALWRASSEGELAFNVAEPLGFDPATASQWQGLVVGRSVTAELERAAVGRTSAIQTPAAAPVASANQAVRGSGPPLGGDRQAEAGLGLACELGRALGTLAVSSISPSTVTGREWQLARSERYLKRISVLRPDLIHDATSLLAELREGFAAAGPGRQVVLHGSPHPHQWLIDDSSSADATLSTPHRVGLVDFDRLAFGEPELDLATFTTEVELGSGDTDVLSGINRAFISGYEAVAGSINPDLLRLYEANKRLALAMTAATTLKPGAWPKVARRLQRARDLLQVAR